MTLVTQKIEILTLAKSSRAKLTDHWLVVGMTPCMNWLSWIITLFPTEDNSVFNYLFQKSYYKLKFVSGKKILSNLKIYEIAFGRWRSPNDAKISHFNGIFTMGLEMFKNPAFFNATTWRFWFHWNLSWKKLSKVRTPYVCPKNHFFNRMHASIYILVHKINISLDL